MPIPIPTDSAIVVRRPAGSRVKFVNQSSVDVFLNLGTPGLLNAWLPGTGGLFSSPNATIYGTKLGANGGETQFECYPCGGVWFRAPSNTTIEIQ